MNLSVNRRLLLNPLVNIKNHKIISGATILGNGEVALILDVNSLI